MKVFDFDNTIYDGESAVDFFLFVLNKKKHFTKYIPLMVYALFMYKANFLSLSKVQKIADKCSHEFVKHQDEAFELVQDFWKSYSYKLKSEILNMIDENDVIITASPNVLIQGIQNKLKTSHVICSSINMKNGSLEFLCMAENKVKAFLERYPNITPDEFYTDSMSDAPLMKVAKKTFLVRGDKISLIYENGCWKKRRS